MSEPMAKAEEQWLNRQSLDVRSVFYAVADAGGWYDDMYFPFRTIENRTGLSRPVVRRACRLLARRGLLAYARGLFNESTGEPGGAGYGLTRHALALEPIPGMGTPYPATERDEDSEYEYAREQAPLLQEDRR